MADEKEIRRWMRAELWQNGDAYADEANVLNCTQLVEAAERALDFDASDSAHEAWDIAVEEVELATYLRTRWA